MRLDKAIEVTSSFYCIFKVFKFVRLDKLREVKFTLELKVRVVKLVRLDIKSTFVILHDYRSKVVN